MRRSQDKKEQQKIAQERVAILFHEAEKVFSRNPVRANRYVALARKIMMKANLSPERKFKRKFCKHCNVFLQPGTNVTVRIRNGKVIIYCHNCKKYTRIPVHSKQLAKKPGKE